MTFVRFENGSSQQMGSLGALPGNKDDQGVYLLWPSATIAPIEHCERVTMQYVPDNLVML